jgi:hypothetical protein
LPLLPMLKQVVLNGKVVMPLLLSMIDINILV